MSRASISVQAPREDGTFAAFTVQFRFSCGFECSEALFGHVTLREYFSVVDFIGNGGVI